MIDVALTPADLRAAGTIVVIDALRATSTIVQALAGGCRAVLCCSSYERAAALRGRHRVLAGEVGCLPPAGFDLGNSPRDVGQARGRELVLATTNGTRTIVAAAATGADVRLGALLNLDALVGSLSGEVLLACAGAEGRPSVEDAYVAGVIAERLSGPRSDTARIAQAAAAGACSALSAFSSGDAARRLVGAGLGADVAWCARASLLDVVPRVVEVDDGVAVVAAHAPALAGRHRPGAVRPGQVTKWPA
jgi:2-phosphosulfolactate phosphatase